MLDIAMCVCVCVTRGRKLVVSFFLPSTYVLYYCKNLSFPKLYYFPVLQTKSLPFRRLSFLISTHFFVS
jgi:hypothetical protein